MNMLHAASIAAAYALAFSTGAIAQSLSQADYKSGKDTIAAEYKTAKAACASQTGNAKDICMAEARGKEKVAKAELAARNKPGDKSSNAVIAAKAKADYAVAKEKCDDQTGAGKTACVKEARAAQTRAMADQKPVSKSADAGKPAKETATVAASNKETPKELVADSVITAKVKAAVLEESTLKSAEINVETYKGTVQLSGFVRSQTDINKAVEVARKVKGVSSVKNDMVVKGQQ